MHRCYISDNENPENFGNGQTGWRLHSFLRLFDAKAKGFRGYSWAWWLLWVGRGCRILGKNEGISNGSVCWTGGGKTREIKKTFEDTLKKMIYH